MHTVELKAWHNGLLTELLLVIPAEGTWDEAWARVHSRLEEAKISASLFGGQLTLDCGSRRIEPVDLEWLVDRLRTLYGLQTVAVVTTDNATRETARRMILNVHQMVPGSSRDTGGSLAKNNALYLSQTIRSGQRIVHDGHLVIGGDVNAGAEVIAAGDIVIVGALRGLAHAGSNGDESARIFAGMMRPYQLRIAGQIARAPEESAAGAQAPRRPEVARIENGSIQVYAV